MGKYFYLATTLSFISYYLLPKSIIKLLEYTELYPHASIILYRMDFLIALVIYLISLILSLIARKEVSYELDLAYDEYEVLLCKIKKYFIMIILSINILFAIVLSIALILSTTGVR